MRQHVAKSGAWLFTVIIILSRVADSHGACPLACVLGLFNNCYHYSCRCRNRASGRNRTSAHPSLRQGVVDRDVSHSRPAPAYSRSCCSSLQAFAGMKSGGRPGQACKYLGTEVPPAVWVPVFPGCHQGLCGRAPRMGAGLSRLSSHDPDTLGPSYGCRSFPAVSLCLSRY